MTAVLGLSALCTFAHALPLFIKRFDDPLLATLPFQWWEWPWYLLPFVLLMCAGISLQAMRRAERKDAA